MNGRQLPPLGIALPEPTADRANRNHEERLRSLEQAPSALLDVIPSVALKDGVATPIAHKLGRPARWVRESCVRGAATTGRVEEVRSGQYDRREYVVLKATGFGATITVDVAVL